MRKVPYFETNAIFVLNGTQMVAYNFYTKQTLS